MSRNPILDELYAVREKLLADAGGDIHKYLEGVRDREAASGRLLPQKTARCTLAADASVVDSPSPAVR